MVLSLVHSGASSFRQWQEERMYRRYQCMRFPGHAYSLHWLLASNRCTLFWVLISHRCDHMSACLQILLASRSASSFRQLGSTTCATQLELARASHRHTLYVAAHCAWQGFTQTHCACKGFKQTSGHCHRTLVHARASNKHSYCHRTIIRA